MKLCEAGHGLLSSLMPACLLLCLFASPQPHLPLPLLALSKLHLQWCTAVRSAAIDDSPGKEESTLLQLLCTHFLFLIRGLPIRRPFRCTAEMYFLALLLLTILLLLSVSDSFSIFSEFLSTYSHCDSLIIR